MKKIIQTILILHIFICSVASANSLALTDTLSEIFDLSDKNINKVTDKVIVVSREGVISYIFAGFPNESLSSLDKEKFANEYGRQLEKSNWKKFDMGSFVEFEKQSDNCNLLLQIVDTAFANRVLRSTKALPDDVYFILNIRKSCDSDKWHAQITTQFKQIEVFDEDNVKPIKPPAQPYGAIKQFSQIPEYSASLTINDLLDFDSHLTLSPLKECHIESLFSAGHQATVGCFIEDRSKYPRYAELDESIVYDSEPYVTSRATSFFRKQGFYTLDSDSKETKAGVNYDKISYENSSLPNLQDVGLMTQIKPQECKIMVWLFTATDDSPLWKDLAFKTIKVKSENGKIKFLRMYEKINYLVSIAPMSACK